MHIRDSKDHTLTLTNMNQYFNIVSRLGLCFWTAENRLGNVGWLAASARARIRLGHKFPRRSTSICTYYTSRTAAFTQTFGLP